MGIVNVSCFWWLDEARSSRSWEVTGGTLMYDAIIHGSWKAEWEPAMKAYPGWHSRHLWRQARAMSGWWHDLIEDGTNGSTYHPKLFQRRMLKSGTQWTDHSKDANPLTAISPGRSAHAESNP